MRDLRAIPGYASTPVAALTGFAALHQEAAQSLGLMCCFVEANQCRTVERDVPDTTVNSGLTGNVDYHRSVCLHSCNRLTNRLTSTSGC